MKAGQVAVFPLAFVAHALSAHGKGTNHRLCDRFGYMRGRKMTPAVIYSTPDLSYVHCGKHPLVACVEMSYDKRWRTVAFAYYNDHDELVIPA